MILDGVVVRYFLHQFFEQGFQFLAIFVAFSFDIHHTFLFTTNYFVTVFLADRGFCCSLLTANIYNNTRNGCCKTYICLFILHIVLIATVVSHY